MAADVETDYQFLNEFFTKTSIDQIDESRLSPLRDASPEPTIEFAEVDLSDIVPSSVEPKVQETVKCKSCTYSWEDGDEKHFVFVYRNRSPYELNLTMDFTGSNNLNYDPKNHQLSGDVIQAQLAPFEETIVLQITAVNSEGWSLTSEVNLKFTPSSDAQASDVAEQAIRERLNRFQSYGQPNGKSIVHWLHGVNEHFIDTEFPPLRSSLFLNPESRQGDNAVWRRARDFAPDLHIIDSVDPNDIDQGELGDCWILSSIAALAEHEDRIRDILVTKRVNQVGVYQVKLCITGVWETITLDEYFPCYPSDGPKYVKAAGGELYVGLLEKAFAKKYCSYEACVEGDSGNGMTTLTGCPVRTIRFKDLDESELWRHIVDGAGNDDDLITISTSLPKSRLAKSGLITNHSYTILNIGDYNETKLLQVRNPWGSGEWEGDWSDKSDCWTEDAIAAVGPTLEDDDGTFWMSFKDALNFFQRMTVCYCEPGTQVTRMPFMLGNIEGVYHYVRVAVTVPEGGRVQWIGLHQPDNTIKGVPTDYTDIATLVFRRDENGEMQPVDHFVSYKNYMFQEVNLEEGEYELLIFTSGRHLDPWPERFVTLTLHRNCACFVKKSPMSDPEYLTQRLISFAKGQGEKVSYLQDRLFMYYCHSGSLHIWAVENVSDDYELEVTANLTLNNMVTALFCHPGDSEYKVDIPCHTQRLVTAAVIKDYKQNSGMTRNMNMTGRPV